MPLTQNIIPLNTFTKDEIYTFLSGLLTAGTWLFHTSHSTPIALDVSLIVAWIGCTALIHIINLLYTIVITMIVAIPMAKQDNNDLEKMKHRIKPFRKYISDKEKHNLIQAIHIIGITVISFSLSSYPIYIAFFKEYLHISMSLYYICLATILIEATLISILITKIYYPIDILERNGEIFIYNSKKFEEEMAVCKQKSLDKDF